MSRIRWTSSIEQHDRPATEAETRAMKDRAFEAMVDLGRHLELRRVVTDSLNREEAQLRTRLRAAMEQASTSTVRTGALIGYDLDAGETVLADPKTGAELVRRPITEAERYAAERMPTGHQKGGD